jgi:hypothetical protein
MMMTMPSEKGADRRGRFNATRISTGNVPTLPAIFPNGVAPVGRTNDDERELLNIRWGMLGPQFSGGRDHHLRGGGMTECGGLFAVG